MLPAKYAKLAVQVLALLLIAAISFFVVTAKLPETDFVKDSLKSVEDSSSTVMKLSAATLATSLAISALPDDFATPLADSLADMNVYFIAILAVLLLEKILIGYGIELAFAVVIPLACVMLALSIGLKKEALKTFAVRLCVLALTVAFVVPVGTHTAEYVAADLAEYVEETIVETEAGAGKLNEAMQGGETDKTVFEKLSDIFQTAVDSVSDLMLHFRNTIRKCMNSIAILILTNCLIPLITFFILRWMLKESFHVVIPLPPLKRRRRTGAAATGAEAMAGEE